MFRFLLLASCGFALLTASPAPAQTPDALKLKGSAATAAAELSVAPGFKVELLKSATTREGSWVSMAVDDQGRLYISPQNKAPDGGIMRITLNDAGQVAKTDWVKSDVGGAMGMLWAFNSLYVSGQGPDGQAIYRLRDTDADGDLDSTALFKKVPGGNGEHGAHAIVLGPDGKSLFFSHGNGTPLVDGVAPDSPYRHWAEDDLLPRVMDSVATFFDDVKVPYGHILRTDENGTRWELYAGGLRNQYDIDFNADGELFTYDSDMEWDVGLPWYRPTRILHIVPGGEYGFREASAKWPDYYPDSLPPVVDIGLGSPTGVKFGWRSNFPEKYRDAFFVMDWTFGRILAVHMQPKGASYSAQGTAVPAVGLVGFQPAAVGAAGGTPARPTAGTAVPHPTGPTARGDVEVFLSGKGLPVSDLEFGKDRAMYFITGGRGTQSGLYRVSFPQPKRTTIGGNCIFKTDGIRERRERWEELASGIRSSLRFDDEAHARESEQLFATLVEYVEPASSPHDRFLALRLIEQFDVETLGKLLLERDLPELSTRGHLISLLALARVGKKADQEPLLKALTKWPLESLDEELKLLKLRVIKLSFARHGRPGLPDTARSSDNARSVPGRVGVPPAGSRVSRDPSEVKEGSSSPSTPQQRGKDAGKMPAPGSPTPRPPLFPSATSAGGTPTLPGRIDPVAGVTEELMRQYPAGSFRLNRELSELLVWLTNPEFAAVGTAGPAVRSGATDNAALSQRALPGGLDVVTKTLTLLANAPSQEEQIWYATVLRCAAGLTAKQREEYFRWFNQAREFKGGNSLAKFIVRIREEALTRVPEPDRARFLALSQIETPKPAPAPARPVVQNWTVTDLAGELDKVGRARDFDRGKKMYAAAQCAACHLFAGEGGNTGPDLTAAASRYNRRDLLEATIDPNKGISEQYAVFLVKQFDGKKEVAGMIVEENNDSLTVLVDPLRGTTEMISKYQPPKRELLPTSSMPPGLLNTLSKEEILDLLAYIESAGNSGAAVFAK